jgi:hypothetical protein
MVSTGEREEGMGENGRKKCVVAACEKLFCLFLEGGKILDEVADFALGENLTHRGYGG